MSLASLARDEIVKKEQPALQRLQRPEVIELTARLAQEHQIDVSGVDSLADELLPLAAKQPVEGGKGASALDKLIKYIPTESVTLYLATVSAIGSQEAAKQGSASFWVFWLFVGLTPVLFLLIYIGKRRSASLAALPATKDFPWWKLLASTIAFGSWALAVPGSPYQSMIGGGAIAALLAVFVSTFLSLLEPIFDPPAPS